MNNYICPHDGLYCTPHISWWEMLPTNGERVDSEWREPNYFKQTWRVLLYLGGIWWNIFNDAAKEYKKELDEIKITARWLDQVATLVFKVLDEEIVPTAAESSPSTHAGLSSFDSDAEASPSSYAGKAKCAWINIHIHSKTYKYCRIIPKLINISKEGQNLPFIYVYICI